jgi:hypothetical protein
MGGGSKPVRFREIDFLYELVANGTVVLYLNGTLVRLYVNGLCCPILITT